MSEVKVNKISPRSGTDVTLGDSSDIFTVPSGVGLTLTDSTLLLPTTITSTTEVKTNKISPATGVAFTLGDSGDTFTVPSGATIDNLGTATGFGGITVADNWRVNADDTTSSAETLLDTGWEQVDTGGQGTIGSAMTQSSGIFTFPSTGIYFVQFQIYYVNGTAASYTRAIIKHFDGSSTYTALSDVRGYAGSGEQDVVTNSTLFDCQATATDQVVFYGGGTNTSNVIAGSTSDNRTAATFIRLGDT